MNKRISILLILAAVTLMERSFSVYQFFFDQTRSGTPPFTYTIEDKYLTVESIGSKTSNEWSNPAFVAGLRKNDRLLEAYTNRGEGIRISGFFDFGDALRKSRKYEPWILVIQRSRGSQELGVILPPHPESKQQPNDRLLLIWIRFILPSIMIVAGFFIGFSRPKNDHAFLACLLFLSLSTLISANRGIYSYPPGIREISFFFQIVQNSLAGYLFLLFFLLFPFPSPLERKAPWLKKATLLFSIVGLAYTLSLEFTKAISFEYYSYLRGTLRFTEPISLGMSLMLAQLGIASLLLNRIKKSTQNDKRRMTLLFAGITSFTVILSIVLTYNFSDLTNASGGLVIVAFASGILFPLFFAYAVVRHRVFGMSVIIRRGIRYLLASRGSYIIAAALIFTALYLTVGAATFHLEVSAIPGVGWRLGTMAALAFGLAMTLPAINRRLMPYIDRKFFERAYNSHRILGDLSRAIQRQPIKPEMLIDLAISQIHRALSVDRVAVFLRGAKIVDASADADESQEFSIAWIRRKEADYQCCEIRDWSEFKKQRIISAEELQDLLLPNDGFVVKELQEKTGEPQVLEIDWNDPVSWIQIHKSDIEHPETIILKQMNARLIVPMTTNRQLLGFLTLGEKPSEEPYSKEEKELLVNVAYQMAIAVDYSLQSDRLAEQEKLRREIEIAKQVQGQLFPQRLPVLKTLDYIGICRAAREVGGDYYDFLEIGPGRLGFVVADISGKGISAALLMASLQALLRSHAHLHGDRAELLVWDINRLMHSSTTNGKYASLFYGFYDDLSGLLAYVNAGHLPPILLRKDGSIVRLRTGGMVVGMMPDTAYKQEIVKLQAGDILLIFSDGITEAMNTKDQEFGEERLLALISSLADLSAASISEAILKSIADYVGTAPQHDDSTLVVIKAV